MRRPSPPPEWEGNMEEEEEEEEEGEEEEGNRNEMLSNYILPRHVSLIGFV